VSHAIAAVAQACGSFELALAKAVCSFPNRSGPLVIPKWDDFQQVSAGPISVHGHGQMILTSEDLDFIRAQGTGVGAPRPDAQFQFYDAAQPEKQD
jgi:hypothetical protein